MGYFRNLLIASDRQLNVLLAGDPDETVSARAGRLRYQYPHTWGLLADTLDAIRRKHVENAIVNDQNRAEHTEDVEKEARDEGL